MSDVGRGSRKAAAVARGAGFDAPTPLSDLKMRPLEWLLPKLIPLGAITVLTGEPGLGKSLFTLSLAARLSRGELATRSGGALLLSAEDSREHTLLPRVVAAGGDLSRIVVPPRPKDGLELPLLIPDDIEQIRHHVVASKSKLVVVDPFSAHLPGSVNGNSDKSVRGALAPLAALAEKHQVAVVLVAHLNKGEGFDPVRRIGGSIALAAAARSVLLLTRDPDDSDGVNGSMRVLGQVKNNLAPHQGSIAYRIESRQVTGHDDPVAVIHELGPSHFTGEQLLALNQPETRLKRDEARAFLQVALADGPKPVAELMAAARELGISATTLDRAKNDLEIKSVKDGLGGGWVWVLPEPVALAMVGSAA